MKMTIIIDPAATRIPDLPGLEQALVEVYDRTDNRTSIVLALHPDDYAALGGQVLSRTTVTRHAA